MVEVGTATEIALDKEEDPEIRRSLRVVVELLGSLLVMSAGRRLRGARYCCALHASEVCYGQDGLRS